MASPQNKPHRTETLRISSARLNTENCAAISSQGHSLIESGATELLVDVSEVTFVDSSGIGALVGLRKKVGEHGSVVLLNPQPFVRKVLSLTKMTHLFEIR
ncbi:MAG: STAS domain-containing protein [Pseudomonadota bacterium]